MASRRRAREYALQALYTADLKAETVPTALTALWAGQLDGEGIEGARAAEVLQKEGPRGSLWQPGRGRWSALGSASLLPRPRHIHLLPQTSLLVLACLCRPLR